MNTLKTTTKQIYMLISKHTKEKENAKEYKANGQGHKRANCL